MTDLRLLNVWAAVLLALPLGAQVQPPAPASSDADGRVRVGDVGPGTSGRILRLALARPHVLLRPGSGATVALPRGTSYPTTVIVLYGDATVGSIVQGDVIVVGGDLFLHPGAMISGRAIAIGGGVYNSTLAIVRGGRLSFRDHTFSARVVDGTTVLTYQEIGGYTPPLLAWPLARGFRIPLYDRVNGASIAFGPLVSLDDGAIEIDPTVTYRSHLGAVDGAVEGRWFVNRRNELSARVQRATFTNDAWIRGDLINSLTTFAVAKDSRNYFRSDRVDAVASRRYETATAEFTPYVGALTERDWSVGPEPDAQHAAFSILGRRDREEGMLRVNPPINRGRLTSAFVGSTARWEDPQGVIVEANLRIESAFDAPLGSFSQGTLDAGVSFPAFRDHTYSAATHLVMSVGDSTSRQRYVYLGGSGTLPTRPLLEMGGDRLFFVEQQYSVPFERVRLWFLGSPTFALRHMIGSAGIEELPDFRQNVGVRVLLSFFRADYSIDPENGDSKFSVGLSLGR